MLILMALAKGCSVIKTGILTNHTKIANIYKSITKVNEWYLYMHNALAYKCEVMP